MPIVILSEHKTAYLDSLEKADSGDFQVFVDFMLARSLDTMQLVEESVRAALAPRSAASIEAITKLYITRGGYSHEQVDAAGTTLIDAARVEFEKITKVLTGTPKLQPSLSVVGGSCTSTFQSTDLH
jgi:hypothetical protein